MSIYPKDLTQEDRNQASAATLAELIRPTLRKLVNPETGERKGKMKGIMKTKTYPVYAEPEEFERRYFVSDPYRYKKSVHSTRDSTVNRFRFVRDGNPVHNDKYFNKSKKGGKKSHKKSGRKSGKKTYKRRH
jgi:hypothetical protein